MMRPYDVKSWCAWRWGISILPIDRSACKLSMQRTDVSESSDMGKPPAAFWRHTCARGEPSPLHEVSSSCRSRIAMHRAHLLLSLGRRLFKSWPSVQDFHALPPIHHVISSLRIWPVRTWNCIRSLPMQDTLSLHDD